jgi:hypothetical protein
MLEAKGLPPNSKIVSKSSRWMIVWSEEFPTVAAVEI